MDTTELHENYFWLASHGTEMAGFSGKWVAIAHREVIAASDSLKNLLANPSVKNDKQPFVTKIPTPEDCVTAV